ncbi:MAG: OPT family oligopeptide transporter [Planctomycetota bacterium]
MSDGSTTPPPESDPAHEWFRNVYQGDHVRQLSVRSIVTGMLIGGVMSISNLYVGLKTGWGLGVTITASIIAYAVFQALESIIPAYRKNPFTILENYTMSSAASAAGYMSSAGLVSAIPALYITTGRYLTAFELMSWIGVVSLLGVFMAVPLKRQMINEEQLPFPSGIATAETLKSLHSDGNEAKSKAYSLLGAGLLGGFVGIWKGFYQLFAISPKLEKELSESSWVFPETFPLLPGKESWLKNYGWGWEGSLILMAAGAIMGIRVGVSMLISAIFYFAILGPWLVDQGWVVALSGKRLEPEIRLWTLWPGTAVMVSSGLLSFAFRWRTIVRALSNFLNLFTGAKTAANDPMEAIEVPAWWYLTGIFVTGGVCVYLAHRFFQIHVWMGIVAVLVTFILSMVAARATGETDITPIGAMGKITQFLYAKLAPSALTTNLMTASITSGASSHAADLLSDLKTGYLLGGNPRKQLISQLFGVFAGTLFAVPIYMFVASAHELDLMKEGNSKFSGPSVMQWAKFAELLANGTKSLPTGAGWAILIGAIVGAILVIAEETLPKKYKPWIPSPTGVGLAAVIPAFNSLAMFIGAFIAWLLQKIRPDVGDRYTVTVSSGLIAGESIAAVSLPLIGLAIAVIGGSSWVLKIVEIFTG